MRKIGSRTWMVMLLAAVLLVAACSSGEDDDDDSGDDDSGDDDSGDDDDDSQTNDPPVISNLNVYPDELYPGDTINMIFDVADPDANVTGGLIRLTIDGIDYPPIEIISDPGAEGKLDVHQATGTDWEPGKKQIQLSIEDADSAQSNSLEGFFNVLEPNTPPIISNLRFDPNPACTQAGTEITLLFDFEDPDGNIGGGSLVVVIDGTPLNPFIISPEFEETEGTLELVLTLLEDAPDGTKSHFLVWLGDNQGAPSNQLHGDLWFDEDACVEDGLL